METKNSPELFRYEEWTIENFSFWNRAIHGDVITTSKSYIIPEFVFHLFPRGLDGNGEYLEVLIHCSEAVTFSGELSFIGSDGSILFTHQMNCMNCQNDVAFPHGPKFEEVISKIRKDRDIHGDHLTIRSRIRRNVGTKTNRRTKIDVFPVSFRISPKIFDDLDSGSKMVSWILYPSGKKDTGQLAFRISNQKDCEKSMLTLEAVPFKGPFSVHTRMSVLNDEDGVLRTEENEHLFNHGEIWAFEESLAREEVAAKGRSLVLHFKIVTGNINNGYVSVCHYHSDAVSVTSTEESSPDGQRYHFPDRESNPSHSSLQYLSKELMCLFQDQDFSDFRFKCGDVTFPVHKSILSARSPVFKTMLSTDMKETASGQVDIEDLDPSTLALFLAFLYTGTLEDLQSDRALKLYYAADKYQVPSLKKECHDFLCSKVSFSNVCDILSLADKHQDDQMTSAAQDFILNNYNDVLSSDDWASFMRNEPLLAVETVTHFAKKNHVGKIDSF